MCSLSASIAIPNDRLPGEPFLHYPVLPCPASPISLRDDAQRLVLKTPPWFQTLSMHGFLTLLCSPAVSLVPSSLGLPLTLLSRYRFSKPFLRVWSRSLLCRPPSIHVRGNIARGFNAKPLRPDGLIPARVRRKRRNNDGSREWVWEALLAIA